MSLTGQDNKTAQNQHLIFPSKETGIGLRSFHYQDLLDERPDIGWIEVHPENYFGGGEHRHYLAKARELYPLSFHAVGLSLGSDQPVSRAHLKSFKELIDIYEPFHVSDHASWSASGNAHLNDLLPLPYTNETLSRLATNVMQVQDFFQRQILVENPSTYISFKHNDMTEAAFMNALARRAGCRILLDVNNIFVQSQNHGFDPYEYIDHIETDFVGEIHLAGHTKRDFGEQSLLVDTHNRYVSEDVWILYRHAIQKFGAVKTLIEWDDELPALAELVNEANKAQAVIENVYKEARDHASC